ncbi:MAG: helix-turn-helix transcriptional regulator [Micavibrio aeruginosavorus]|nr:helix-turn-helix transcriptional regulator [Micavibrio aeruginosavorus]
MFTHDDIWTAIDRLAEAHGLSPSGLARQAGLDATAFNRSKRISPNGKPRWPSTESLSKILDVTNSTMSDLLDLMDGKDIAPRSIPLLSYPALRSGRLSSEKGTVALAVAYNVGDDAFAVHIEDNRLSPLFRRDALLIADQVTRAKADDRILFYLKKGGLKGGIVKSLQRRNYTVLVPGDNFEESVFPESNIEWIARILWSSH